MDPLETELKEALKGTAPLQAGGAASLTRRIAQEYRRKQKAAGRFLMGSLIVQLLALLVCIWAFFQIQDQKLSLLMAVGIVIIIEGTVLMTLWYWILHGKIAIVRELKLLQLLVAERSPLPSGGSVLAEDERTFSEEELDKPSNLWLRALLLSVWVCAVIGWVSMVFPHLESIPKGAELYYERTLKPGDNHEITEKFRVERSKARFHPVVVPEQGHAEAWIAVGPEGATTWYQGPASDSSRFWFGRDLPVGSYSIRVKSVQASAPYQLRVYGVDEPKTGLAEPRTFWNLLFAAVAIAIPLGWFQARILRGIDPELAR